MSRDHSILLRLTDHQRSRFWSRVRKGEGCWEWTGWLSSSGYGHIRLNRVTFLTHRVSWILANGPIPDRLFVCHRCDNPKCVRPDHLFLGDAGVNTRDARSKGRMSCGDQHYSRLHPERLARGDRSGPRLHPERMARGEKNWSSKLTEDAVRIIRREHAAGTPLATLARRYCVAFQSVWRIVRRLTWKHVLG